MKLNLQWSISQQDIESDTKMSPLVMSRNNLNNREISVEWLSQHKQIPASKFEHDVAFPRLYFPA